MSVNPVTLIAGALALLMVTAGCEPVQVQEHVAIKYIGSEPVTEPSAGDCVRWLWVEMPYEGKSGETVKLVLGANSIPDDWVSPKIEDGYKITVFKIPGEIDKINLTFNITLNIRSARLTGLYPPHAKLTDVSGNQIGIAPLAKIPGTNAGGGIYETEIRNIPIEGARLELPTFAYQVEHKNYRWKPSGYLLLIPTKDSVRICA